MEGVIEKGALYESLVALGNSGRTGILTVQGEEEIVAFSLLDGEIVSADALNETLEEGLGELLVGRGVVTEDEFAGLSAEFQAGGGRVVDLLVERSFLSRQRLLDLLREHTYRLCLEVFRWEEGSFRFYPGDEVAFEEGFRAITVDEFCVRAAEDLGADGPIEGGVVPPTSILGRVAKAFGEPAEGSVPDSPGTRGGEESPLAAQGEAASPEAVRLFELVDGRHSLEEQAAAAGMSLFTAQHLAQRWVSKGLVSLAVAAVQESEEAMEAVEAVPTSAVADLDDMELLPSPLEVPVEPAVLEEDSGPVSTAAGPETLKSGPEPGKATPWPSRLMGLALWAAAALLLVAYPSRLLLPFPWQGGLRDAYQREQRALKELKIDRAATTFFLLNGRYPESLDDLAAGRLLAPDDLFDPTGRPLTLSSATASYSIGATGEDAAGDVEVTTSSIARNFLLDPAFRAPERASQPPLVLLD